MRDRSFSSPSRGLVAQSQTGAALAATFILCLTTLMACDSQKISELEEGVSTEADVRKRFGEPTAVYTESNGDVTFEYPRQPAGHVNYMISIGPDGKMSALRQVLKLANFKRVTPGLDRSQVRRLLGRPAKAQSFALKEEEVWDWRYRAGPQVRLFSVTFDKDGKVVGTASGDDPRETQVGGK